MTEQEKCLHRCCFAGHRPEGILLSETTAKEWLRFQIQQAMTDGYTTFITGMGMGVDIWAAQIVLELREANPSLHLIAVEPYPGFSAKWTEEWRNAYQEVIAAADLVKRISKRYAPDAINNRLYWMVDHSSRLIAIYNGTKGYTGAFVDYAVSQGLKIDLYPFPRMNKGASTRPYPLNLIDEVMNSPTYLTSKPVEFADVPADFDKRLAIAISTFRSNHDPSEILLPRFRDEATLQEIASNAGVTRERIRQLIEQYIKRLRHPDIMRYLNCGIESIPPKTSKAMIKRLEDAERLWGG